MMGKLTQEDRCKIEALYKAGVNASKIAQQLGVIKSQITESLEGTTLMAAIKFEEAIQLPKNVGPCAGGPR